MSLPPSPDHPETVVVHVLKDGARLGPFTADDLLDLIDEGVISYDDVCLRAGSIDCERVRQVLDWEGEPDPELGGAVGAVEFNEDEEDENLERDGDEDEEFEEDEIPDQAPAPAHPRSRAVGPPRNPNLILYAGHPSVLSFPKTLALILACAVGAFYGREHSAWWLFSGLVAALFGVSWILLERSMRLYLITPRRVELVCGLIAKNSQEVRIEDIRAINVRTPGLRGLFGVGSVEFASAGGGPVDVAFTDVYAAHRIKGLVRRLQDADKTASDD